MRHAFERNTSENAYLLLVLGFWYSYQNLCLLQQNFLLKSQAESSPDEVLPFFLDISEHWVHFCQIFYMPLSYLKCKEIKSQSIFPKQNKTRKKQHYCAMNKALPAIWARLRKAMTHKKPPLKNNFLLLT